jgi:hypothetical protein
MTNHLNCPKQDRNLACSIREDELRGSLARWIGRVDGCVFGDDGNALVVEETGSRGVGRIDQGPLVVMTPVMAANMAACG